MPGGFTVRSNPDPYPWAPGKLLRVRSFFFLEREIKLLGQERDGGPVKHKGKEREMHSVGCEMMCDKKQN